MIIGQSWTMFIQHTLYSCDDKEVFKISIYQTILHGFEINYANFIRVIIDRSLYIRVSYNILHYRYT